MGCGPPSVAIGSREEPAAAHEKGERQTNAIPPVPPGAVQSSAWPALPRRGAPHQAAASVLVGSKAQAGGFGGGSYLTRRVIQVVRRPVVGPPWRIGFLKVLGCSAGHFAGQHVSLIRPWRNGKRHRAGALGQCLRRLNATPTLPERYFVASADGRGKPPPSASLPPSTARAPSGATAYGRWAARCGLLWEFPAAA